MTLNLHSETTFVPAIPHGDIVWYRTSTGVRCGVSERLTSNTGKKTPLKNSQNGANSQELRVGFDQTHKSGGDRPKDHDEAKPEGRASTLIMIMS